MRSLTTSCWPYTVIARPSASSLREFGGADRRTRSAHRGVPSPLGPTAPRPNVTQQLDNPVFDDAGSHSRLDVVTASAFDDDVVNAIKVQEVTQQ